MTRGGTWIESINACFDQSHDVLTVRPSLLCGLPCISDSCLCTPWNMTMRDKPSIRVRARLPSGLSLLELEPLQV